MTNPFEDVNDFGTACDQPASEANYNMYLGLIAEEYNELQDAVDAAIWKFSSSIFIIL